MHGMLIVAGATPLQHAPHELHPHKLHRSGRHKTRVSIRAVQITFKSCACVLYRYDSTAPSPGARKNEVEAMVKAYVLIVTNPGATRRVAQTLSAIPHVVALHEVMGPYDIVLELEAEALTDIPPILSDQIRTLEGIQSTTSLVAFPAG